MINAPYKNPKLSPEERTRDLLPRMTLEEKVGQLLQLDGQKVYLDLVKNYHVGSLLHINGSDADAAIQASLDSRLGIPLLLADDGIHGHSFWAGATIFPTQLAMATSWNPDLLEAVARVTALEMRATGLKWTFSPVLCITRDLRWGRVNETFGEDPWLIGELGAAMIRGYQGSGLSDPTGVLATAKHFAGYSETLGGRDASEADLSRRKLRSWFFPPFERAAKAGCQAFMTGYQSIDGVPSTVNRWLLTDVLRDEWGFEGVLVTDWYNVGHLVHDQKVCADFTEAAVRAIRAGNDLMMACPEFYQGCIDAVHKGLLRMDELDKVVARVLLLKFRMGLFEAPGFSSTADIGFLINCQAHQDLNLRASQESLVLLRNEAAPAARHPALSASKAVLPLSSTTPLNLAVIGPNADNPLAQLGDWSLGSGQMVGPSGTEHPRSAIHTVLDGIREFLPAGWQLANARAADCVVLVLGDSLAETGEGKSTATLELLHGQVELAQETMDRARELGQAVVVVLINSKPLVLPPCLDQAHAIIEAFNPGMQGGRAIAQTLFGHINPSGKLTVSFPAHAGQQPVYYNQVRGQHGTRYADMDQEPVFAFGYGLSYTRFTLGQPRLRKAEWAAHETLEVELEIRNSGERRGSEVIQAYIEDLVTSATWARKELKGFRKVTLDPGQAVTVTLQIPVSSCSMVDEDGRRLVEPGTFRLHVGTSSRARDLQTLEFTVIT